MNLWSNLKRKRQSTDPNPQTDTATLAKKTFPRFLSYAPWDNGKYILSE